VDGAAGVVRGACLMADWLVLLNDQVAADETAAALRSAVPPPWDRLVLLGVARRWRPLTSGVPIAYRAERSKALRLVWAEQEDELRARIDETARRLRSDAEHVDVRFMWGDPVDGAHQVARHDGVCMIVYPVGAYRRLLEYMPGSLAWRLARNAPCAVLFARIPTSSDRASWTEVRPQSSQAH
jgi:nucleotide-binding universal stress UspA family protein